MFKFYSLLVLCFTFSLNIQATGRPGALDHLNVPSPSLWVNVGTVDFEYFITLGARPFDAADSNKLPLHLCDLKDYPEAKSLIVWNLDYQEGWQLQNYSTSFTNYTNLENLQLLTNLEYLSLSLKHPEYLPYSDFALVSEEQWNLIASLPIKTLELRLSCHKDLSFAVFKDHPTLETLKIHYFNFLTDKQFEELKELHIPHLILFADALSSFNKAAFKSAVECINRLHFMESLTLGFQDPEPGFAEILQYDVPPMLNLRKLALYAPDLNKLRVDLLAPNLVYLDLRNTNVSGYTINNLTSMAFLEKILLGNTKISNGAVTNLAKIKTLRWIDLSGTSVKDANFASLKNLPQLEVIDLSHTKISRTDLLQLGELKQVKMINLTGLQSLTVRPEDVQSLKAALPGCTIVTDQN